ncbi:hypothetical protein [Streptomyces acidiscabies]|uniref:Uncharacterized protein n=1 Tax=Streptomyces acidiscabies TaxID=42234 RepID=A0ABU4MCY1_9ACTN|nr:hypothetical protein [Streptomyces acidiscabies]MDX3025359.1 hypothetical protein [Streptomyces acidiscabies]
MNHRSATFAAAYALLRAAADHSDHWGQSDFDAVAKGATDAAPVEYKYDDGKKVTIGTRGGRRACAHHVIQYTATQGLVLVAGTRLLGIRLHPAAVAGALALSGLTHYAADRRVPNGLLHRLAKATGKERFAKLADFGINGSYCLDQSWHHSWETLAALIATVKADER